MRCKNDPVNIGKLEGALDYAEWKRSMEACLLCDDFVLVGICKPFENSNERGTMDYNKDQFIANADIIQHVGSRPQVRNRKIIEDDEKNAYDLWTALENAYTRANTQAVQNLKQRLDVVLYSDGDDWDKHFSMFMATLTQIAS